MVISKSHNITSKDNYDVWKTLITAALLVNLEGEKKCYKFCEANVLETTETGEKLNVNKHLFCNKKEKF